MRRSWFLLTTALLVAACVPAASGVAGDGRPQDGGLPRDAITGMAPSYDGRAPTAEPNLAAIGRAFWMPGLDDGFVPQGLTVMGDEVLVAAYRSTDREQGNGPSRVFRIARADGRVLGGFDLPPAFGHPGGLASDGHTLFVANTGLVLVLDLQDPARPRTVALHPVAKSMGPAFLGCDGTSLWFGPFRRTGAPRIHAVPLARFRDMDGAPVTPADATASLPLPLHAQGATFAATGPGRARELWVSVSSGDHPGRLVRIDPATGAVKGEYEAPGGIEDLGHAPGPDGTDRLWAVSEAGSRRWSGWRAFFPLVFEIDPARLTP